jgi:phosphoglycerol transferase MdoB-like AlkP superfamily enzyme
MIPNHYTFAWKIPGLLLISLSLLRLQTILFNFALFDAASFDLISALRFDISLIAYMSLPLTILIFVASRLKNPTTGIWMIHTYGIIAFQVILIPELWDLIYLNYTAKRASFDVYAFYAIGEDSDQFGSLAQRFWYVLVLYFIWTFAFILGVRKIGRSRINSISLFRSIGLFFISSSIYFLLARNSFGPKPLGIADALKIQHPTSAQFILNSPFVVLKTLQNKSLSRTTLIPLNLEKKHANPRMNISNKGEPLRPNIMFIIVESLGNKQLHQRVNGIPLTPFLDQLATLQNNSNSENGLAEGKTSIECLPALFAGIPSWLETPFILSNFSTNQVTGFPEICNQQGYDTYFVHGAKAGSMRFDAQASSLGFNSQLYRDDLSNSLTEYGSWGLHDHLAFKQISKRLSGSKKPFMLTFFTLSTHEPFDIPQRFIKKYKLPSAEATSYRYFDDQLRAFFKQNEHEPWFKNTIFIITGDHTPVHLDNAQYNTSDYFSVPIFIKLPKGMNKTISVTDQKSIVPALCRALNWNVKLYSFAPRTDEDMIRYLNGIYYIWNDQYELQYNETNTSWRVILKKVKKTSISEKKTLNLKIEESKTTFLSLLQRFRRDLRLNKTHR